ERAQGYLYAGGALGLRGRMEVTQHHWLSAYRFGKRGHADLKKAIALDPRLEDAYLGLGIYDYYADTLKGVQAVLSAIMMHGDRQRGLAEMKRAMRQGKHSRVEAKLFLMDAYASWEKQPENALAIAQELYQEFPHSPVMHLALIGAEKENKQWDQVTSESL